jgi:hypothetical protein
MELFANDIKIPFNSSIVIKFYNPLFNDIGSYSLPVTFNAKIPSVQRAFGFPAVRENTEFKIVTGRIKNKYIDIIGSWKISDANSDEISTYFMPSSGDFYSMIKDKLLSDIDFGGVKYPTGYPDPIEDLITYMNTKMDTYFPESEFAAFSAYMPNADGVNGPVAYSVVNPVVFDAAGDPTFGGSVPYVNYSVYLFAGTVLEYLFQSNGYRVEKNIFRDDTDMQRLVVFNTYNIYDPPQSPNFNIAMVDYQKLLPRITCGSFLKAIRDRFNIGFFINGQQRSVKIISFDTALSAISNTRIIKHIGKPTIENNRLKGLSFANEAPDAWASHDYKQADLAGAIPVLKYRDILPDTREDNDLIYVQSEPGYYRIKFTAPSTYEAIRLCPDLLPYSEGTKHSEMSQSSAIPAMYTRTIFQNFTYLEGEDSIESSTEIDFILPRCDLVGNRWGRSFTEFPLMFLFARGIAGCYVLPATGAPAFKYPLGTSDVYDATGTKISSANLGLRWDGAYGLIGRFWSNRINWAMNIIKRIKTELYSETIADLINMDEVKPIEKNNYFIESFELEMSVKQDRIKNIELLRL